MNRAKLGTLACILATGLLVFPAGGPANAVEPLRDADPASLSDGTSILIPVAFDAEIASQYGYELRWDGSGAAYSVPKTNAENDFTDSAFLGTLDADNNVIDGQRGAVARGTVWGNCGTSSFDFTAGNSQFKTSYSIAPNYGAPISHDWTVTVTTTGMGGQSGWYDLSGLPSWGSPSWSATRAVTQNYTGHANGVASGEVLVTSGTICNSGNPADSY